MEKQFTEHLSGLRKNYSRSSLDVSNVKDSPFEQFRTWFQEAQDGGIIEPNAMTLASVNHEFRVSARIVLLKGIEDGSFIFYTNYESRKAQDLQINPHAALLFFWDRLERQVRIEGRVEKVNETSNVEYFNSRPLESKIGAIVSKQSERIPSREYLEDKFEEISKKSELIQKPENWGGYKVIPSYFEYWQGRESRLHDRIVYENISGQWERYRLSP